MGKKHVEFIIFVSDQIWRADSEGDDSENTLSTQAPTMKLKLNNNEIWSWPDKAREEDFIRKRKLRKTLGIFDSWEVVTVEIDEMGNPTSEDGTPVSLKKIATGKVLIVQSLCS